VLLAEAAERHAARCPSCFALVPAAREEPSLAVARRGGRLSAPGGYAVEVDEDGLQTYLSVDIPERPIYRGREPDRMWTPGGAAFLVGGAFVLLALGCALFWPWRPAPVVVLLLALAGSARWAVALAWKFQVSLRDRAQGYAWDVLAPALHAGGFSAEDGAFLAGLTRMSLRAGPVPEPGDALAGWLRQTEVQVTAKRCPPEQLSWLLRLQAEQAREDEKDALPGLVDVLGRCFAGQLPLAVAEHLLGCWEPEWWTAGLRARLRVLLCDRAFEVGFEIRTLLDAGRAFPALGEALGTDRPAELAALRLLWSLRPTRPWDGACGAGVLTAFELAALPWRADLFGRHPGLLLWQEDSDLKLSADSASGQMAPAVVLLTTAGVWLQGVLFPEPPRTFEVRLRSSGSQLICGAHTFRAAVDLEPLSRRLERWFRYAFHDFLPQVARVEAWRPPNRPALLESWGAVPCPECKRLMVARPGEMGIALG
jgi:hypothetical protein